MFIVGYQFKAGQIEACTPHGAAIQTIALLFKYFESIKQN